MTGQVIPRMNLAQVRLHATSLQDVTEAPHHHFSSFRVRGKIFVTIPPDEEHIHVFVSETDREQALALYPEFVEKLLWGGKAVGLRIALAPAKPAAVKALVTKAWMNKAPKTASAKPPASR